MAINTRHIGAGDSRILRLAPRVGESKLGYRVSGLERNDPIPPGFYYLDIVDDVLASNGVRRIDNFTFWLQANNPPAAPVSRVKVIKSAHRDAGPAPADIPYTQDPFDEVPASDWFLFQVVEPVNRWGNDNGLGLPSIAPKGSVTDIQDTIQSPEAESEFWEDWLPDTPLGKALFVGGAIGLAALVVIAVKS